MITEPFTYSNGRLSTVSSGAWSDSSANLTVSSNTAIQAGSNTSDIAFHQTPMDLNDHYAEVDVTLGGGDYSGGGVIVRGSGNPATGAGRTGYRVELGVWNDAGGNGLHWGITRYDGASSTEVATGFIQSSGAGTHTLRAEADGTALRIYRNGGLLTTYTMTAYGTNKFVGIYVGEFGSSVSLDNFEANNIGTPPNDPYVVESQAAVINNSRSPSLTFTTPPLEDDIVIMWPSSTTTATIANLSPTWVNALGGTTDVESDSHETCCIFHVVTAAEAAANTVTFTATNLYDATELGNTLGCVVRNADPSNVLAGVGSTFNSANTASPHVLAAVTPTADNGLVLSQVVKDATGAYTTQPAGWTFLTTFNTNQGAALLQHNTLSSNGVQVGPTNITPSAGDEYASITVVIRKLVSAPGAPTALAGTSGDAQVVLTWTAPSDGGATITDYDIDWALASAPTTWLGPVSKGAGTTGYTKTGLTNGVAYVFRVRAVNSVGAGAWSATSSSVTPMPSFPGTTTPPTATVNPGRIWFEDFDAIADGNFLPRSPWATSNDNNTWKVFNGPPDVLYSIALGHLWRPMGQANHGIRAAMKMKDTSGDSIGGILVGVADGTHYVGLEPVLHDGYGGSPSPENKIVVYHRDGATHDEFFTLSPAGLEYGKWHDLSLQIDGLVVSAWLDGVLLVQHTLTSGQGAVLGNNAGVVEETGMQNYDWVEGRVPFAGSRVRIAAGTRARVRMADGTAASIRLANGSRL